MPNLTLAAAALADMAQLLDLTAKSIASVTRKFRATLRNLAVSSMTSGTSILADVRRTVRQGIEDAYIEGLISVGLTADDLTGEDARAIEELDLTQQDFIPDFVKAITASRKDKALQREILDVRIPLWAASIENAGQVALANAAKNELVTWQYGDTEHCDTCLKLNGQRHSRQWFASRGYFPGQPGCEALDCKGYNCKCQLIGRLTDVEN